MAEHTIGTQEQWQAQRDELLKEEKELTRRSDELAAKRSRLPWVPVEKDYRFETEQGTTEPRRAVRWPQPAHDLPLHVRAVLRGGMPGLLLDRGHARRPGAAPQGQGHHPDARLPRAAREADRLQAADGLGHRLGVERRQRLQPRHRLHAHGGGAEAVPGRRDPGHGRPERRDVRHDRRRLRRGGAGSQRVHARGRGRLPDVRQHRARPRVRDALLRPARPHAEGSRRAPRDAALAAPPRRVRIERPT